MVAEVRLYERKPTGDLENIFDSTVDFFGVCPSLGDIISTRDNPRKRQRFLKVVQRYFEIDINAPGWTVVLERVGDTKEAMAAHREYDAATKFWHSVDEKEEARVNALADRALEPALKLASVKKRSPRKRVLTPARL